MLDVAIAYDVMDETVGIGSRRHDYPSHKRSGGP